MKKRNKKYNSSARAIRWSSEIAENTAIYELIGGKSEFISFNNVNYSNWLLMKVYLKPKHFWTVALIVFKINEKGEKAIDVNHVSPPEPCQADLIAESVKREHLKMIEKCEPKEFVTAGWMAIPRDEILSSVVITDFFDNLGVWRDYVTNNGYTLKECK